MSRQPVTLADGVFDPLHVGHLAYLTACRAFGDPVIVQVSPQRKRPEFMPLADRRRILTDCGWETVAYPTTYDALLHVRPVRYVKGVDWLRSDIPLAERALCDLYGIAVEFVDPTPVMSSTRLLEAWAQAWLEAQR